MNGETSSPSLADPTNNNPKKDQYIHSTYLLYRKQAFWQIGLPLGFGIIIALGLGVIVVLFSSTNYDTSLYWANISLILLIVLFSLVSLLGLALLIVAIYGVAKLLKITPTYTQLSQAYVYHIAMLIIKYADLSVKPILSVQSWVSCLQTLLARLTRRKPIDTQNASHLFT